MKQLTQDEALDVVRAAITVAGTQKAFADYHQINPNLLTDVLRGRKTISKSILNAVGLERVVSYRRKSGG